jgi:hypothetical protein
MQTLGVSVGHLRGSAFLRHAFPNNKILSHQRKQIEQRISERPNGFEGVPFVPRESFAGGDSTARFHNNRVATIESFFQGKAVYSFLERKSVCSWNGRGRRALSFQSSGLRYP